MGRITLLGVGCGIPDADRDFTSLVWQGEQDGQPSPVLIDAGGSPYRNLLKAGIEPITLRALILTHSHCDHIGGLPSLLFSMWLAGRRQVPLPIYGLEPTIALAKKIVEAFDLEVYAAPIEWHPFAAGDSLDEIAGDGWSLQTAPTIHSRPCVALRFSEKGTGRALAYSCDTAPSDAVTELARDADILIHEATVANPMDSHTTPRQAGEIAARANVKELVLVHYSPRWTLPEKDTLEAVQLGGFMGPTRIGQEGMVVG